MNKCQNCGKPIIFKTYILRLYGEKYKLCRKCYKLCREFKKRHS